MSNFVPNQILTAAELNTAFASDGLNLKDFDASGGTDYSAAFNAAIASVSSGHSGKIILPPGQIPCASAIVASIPAGVQITIEGMGPDSSVVYFSNATDGFSFKLLNFGNTWASVKLTSFSIIRGPVSPLIANTALSIFTDPTIAKSYVGSVILRDLIIAGSGGVAVNQWQHNINLAGTSAAVIDAVTIICMNATQTDQGDTGISLAGQSAPGNQYASPYYISNVGVQGGSVGLLVSGYVQGVYIVNGVIIGQYDSVRWVGGSPVFAEEMAISNCSFNAWHRGVYISQVNQCNISGCVILHLGAGSPNFAGIEVNNAAFNTLNGNNIVGANHGTEAGIIFSGCGIATNVVMGTTTSNFPGGRGISMTGNTANTIVIGNNLSSETIGQDTAGNLILGNSTSGTQNALITNQPMDFVGPNGLSRWFVGNDNTTESGGNTGNNFEIVAASDTGSLLGAPFSIARATGLVQFNAYGGLDLDVGMNGPAASNRVHNFTTADVSRWFAGANAAAESGANAGSDYVIISCSDAGSITQTPLKITRSSGAISLSGALGINGSSPPTKPTVTGSRGSNAALASLLTALASYGLITDGTS